MTTNHQQGGAGKQGTNSTAMLIATVIWLASMAALMWWAVAPASMPSRLIGAVVVTAGFALFALRMSAVTTSGAAAGALVSFILYASMGPAGFLVLAVVFFFTWISTRLGYARKQRLGKAENRAGRSAGQVLANLSMAAGLCAAARLFRLPFLSNLLLIGTAAAMAEAAADTVSSEAGEAWSDRVRLITNWQRVPPGTDGGLSIPGTLAGACAALVVAGVSAAVRLTALSGIPIVAGAAVCGMLFDSFLGATLERRKLLGNNSVNFSSTVFAAAVAIAMAYGMRW